MEQPKSRICPYRKRRPAVHLSFWKITGIKPWLAPTRWIGLCEFFTELPEKPKNTTCLVVATRQVVFLFRFVEMAGIEPASEKIDRRTSTSVVD